MSKIDIIIDEMKEQAHPMRVEDVIEIALKEFAKNHAGEFSGAIAYSIVSRLEENAEKKPHCLYCGEHKYLSQFDIEDDGRDDWWCSYCDNACDEPAML